MARARNIKPAFFTNEQLLACEPLARLLFIGLWCICDREGRLEDRPVKIKIEILPCDNCDADKLLDQLKEHGLIFRYEVDEKRYIEIPTFTTHQKPHQREPLSKIPPYFKSPGRAQGAPLHLPGSTPVLGGENQAFAPASPQEPGLGHGAPALNAECGMLNAECGSAPPKPGLLGIETSPLPISQFLKTPEFLAQEFCRLSALPSHAAEKNEREMTPIMADLVKVRLVPFDEVLAHIQSPTRPKGEKYWQFTKYFESRQPKVTPGAETQDQRRARVLADRAETARRREQARRENEEREQREKEERQLACANGGQR